MKTYIMLLAALSLALFSCKKDDLTLSGEPSAVGAVGNELTFSHSINGLGPVSMTVTSVNEGISTLEGTATVNDADLLSMASHVAGLYPGNITINTNIVSVNMKARFTTDGIASVAPNGDELVVCKYNANVGDEWTLTAGAQTVKHKVTQKSTDDDYDWGVWLIKVVTMEATNYGIPGLNKLEYVSNHKFGPVGVKAYMTDGGTFNSTIFSLFDNE